MFVMSLLFKQNVMVMLLWLLKLNNDSAHVALFAYKMHDGVADSFGFVL